MNRGELGSMPALLGIASSRPAPEAFGSGKFGTPCERMHLENSSACLRAFACAFASGLPPLGRSFRQACCAARN